MKQLLFEPTNSKSANIKKYVCVFLCIFVVLASTACSSAEYETYYLYPNEQLMAKEGTVDSTFTPIPEETNSQLTVDDIMEMNNGDAQMVFSDEGYLTFLNGKYYEGKIEDYEDAAGSIQGIAKILGLSAGTELFAKYGETDDNKYTYYTFQQRYGDATVQYATLRVIVDPEGYTAGVACSFTPNLGIKEETNQITQQEAEDFIRNNYAEYNLTVYTEATSKVVITLNDVVYNAYAVYTNNPDMTISFEMRYLEHFIAYDGTYLEMLPVASTTTENTDPFKAFEYFNGMEAQTYVTDLLLYDGSAMHVEVPIAYNPSDGLYYLCDVERKIMVADYCSMDFHRTLNFITSQDGKSWVNNQLLAYVNYIRAYDFYAEFGINSVDDFDTPILVCVGLKDENGQPVKNAFHFGMNMGWVCFASSDDYNYAECLDITTHEYTHGVTTYSMGDNVYANATGAINEAYSDIMGNICEMYCNATNDETWMIAEMCGEPIRSMSMPRLFNQPASISDPLYQPPTNSPDSYENDNGGVHVNSSLLNTVAYKLWASGMSLEDEAALWITSMELITPLSGYSEVYAALLMSVDINGLNQQYKQVITDAFNDAELLD